MKTFLILILGMASIFPALASECRIDGIQQAPQILNCSYRDGWFIKHYIDIACKNGSYEFEQSTHVGVFDRGLLKVRYDQRNDSILFETKDELIFGVSKKLLNRYQGQMYYLGYETYSQEIRCRAKLL